MLNFYKSRFAVGHKCFVLNLGIGCMWHVLPEPVTIVRVVIETYEKSNRYVVTYKCSDDYFRKEGMQENGEPLTDVLFGTKIEAKSACAARNRVKFS